MTKTIIVLETLMIARLAYLYLLYKGRCMVLNPCKIVNDISLIRKDIAEVKDMQEKMLHF